MIIQEKDYLQHFGILRKSGRYPWGSGGSVTTRSKDFLGHYTKLRDQGVPEVAIAKGWGMTTSELRDAKSIANHEIKAADINQAERLRDKGLSNVEIGKRMDRNESSIRALLAPGAKQKNDVLYSTSNMLKEEVAAKEFVQIGRGVENSLGISSTKLNTAVSVLKDEGYTTHELRVPQPGGKNYSTVKVLAGPGVTIGDVSRNRDKISLPASFSDDGGQTYFGFQPPLNVSSKRIGIKYAEQGGALDDGLIHVRRGVDDVSLGRASYAQVRIAVDGTHYMKGMAIYKDDMPPGVDLVFHTNKSNTGNKKDALKPLDLDSPDQPFGAVVKDQIFKRDAHGNLVLSKSGQPIVTSAMNILNEEGDWSRYKQSISAQVLSKQNPKLIKTQLDATYDAKKQGLDEILALTNPTVRRKLLEDYADKLDSSAVHLEAAALPRQAWHVLIPVNSLKETEVYAPNYRNGERVALVRYPHGGIFEIPELIVNNNHKPAKALLGNAPDAIGIHSKVAEHLSGADFDGDYVIVVPNDKGILKTAPVLKGLKNFDPKKDYPAYEGMPRMSSRSKGLEMGSVTNLINDMTIQGASQDEIARAVRHSMVVIDAEKHNLNYKLSAINNGIPQLKEKYQGGKRGGAFTLLSKAESEIRVADRPARRASAGGPIDKATGKKMFEETPRHYVTKDGKVVYRKRVSKKLAETEDAFTLVSKPGTVVETMYATHSNKLKALANEARKEMVHTAPIQVNQSARTTYAQEIKSLDAKLNLAKQNAPLERQALLISNSVVTMKKEAKPGMTAPEIKKIESQSLNAARARLNAKKQDIWIEDNEWEAIQAGAISNNKLTQILDQANGTRVRQLATPKTTLLMTSSKKTRAVAMLASGYTQAQVADALGMSLSTLKQSL